MSLKEVYRDFRRSVEQFGFYDFGVVDPAISRLDFAKLLGEVFDSHESSDRLVAKDLGCSGPNTYSGLFGLEEFPLHTDLAHWHSPPRYILLRVLTSKPWTSS